MWHSDLIDCTVTLGCMLIVGTMLSMLQYEVKATVYELQGSQSVYSMPSEHCSR